jgi:Zn-dependent protease with chaperone function
MLALVLGIVIYIVLHLLKEPFQKNIDEWIFLAINGVLSIYLYIIVVFSRPWKGMLYLRKRDYPELYRRVNWVARTLNAPKIHRIYLYGEYNAAVLSENIFIPGLKRNVLMLGYPLLASCSSKALLGCLAHEFGHLTGKHCSWRKVFFYVETFLATFQLGVFTLVFIYWRNRLIEAIQINLLPIYYKHEVEADLNVIDKLGADYAAEFLLQLEIKQEIFEKDKTFYERIADTKDIKSLDFAGIIRDSLTEKMDIEKVKAQVKDAMKKLPMVFDEHPSFQERISQTGIDDYLQYAITEPDVLEKLLGNSKNFIDDVNKYYFDNIPHEQIKSSNELNLRLLKDFDIKKPYELKEAFESTQALNISNRKNECRELLELSIKRFPDSKDLKCEKLIYDLEQTEDEKEKSEIIKKLEDMVYKSPMLIYPVNDPLLLYYINHGKNDKIKDFFDFRDKNLKRNIKLIKKKLSKNDTLTPVSINDFDKNKIIQEISKKRGVGKIYLIQRLYDGLLVGTYFIVIRLKTLSGFTVSNQSIDELQDIFPEYKIVIGKNKFCKETLDAIPGSLLWDRKNKR